MTKILGVLLLALVVGVPAANATTVTWTGQQTVTSTEVDHYVSGDDPALTYEANLTWKATLTIDAKGNVKPSAKGGTVTGTATRYVDSDVACSGKVTGQTGPPAVSVSRSGTVTFEASLIPGWDGGANACYGGFVPPIVTPISRSKLRFKATAKLSKLKSGSASASDSNSADLTKDYPSPGGASPAYTRRTQVSWSASAGVQTCRGTHKPIQGGVCNDKLLGALCIQGVPSRPSDKRATMYKIDVLSSDAVSSKAIVADLTKQLDACANRGNQWRPVHFALPAELEDGDPIAEAPEAAPGQPVGKSLVEGYMVGGGQARITGFRDFNGRPFINDTGRGAGPQNQLIQFELTVPVYRVHETDLSKS